MYDPARSSCVPSSNVGRVERGSIILSLLLLLLAVLGALPQASAQAIWTVTTLAGGNGGTASGSTNGVGTAARFDNPAGVALSADGSLALVVSIAEFCMRSVVA